MFWRDWLNPLNAVYYALNGVLDEDILIEERYLNEIVLTLIFKNYAISL